MQFFSVDRFSEIGSASLPGGFVAVGIAPWSELDICLVGGHRLGPGRLVPYSPSVTAIRGFRTGTLGDGATSGEGIGTMLALVLYERCDALVPPPPRSPVFVSADLVLATATLVGANPTLRLPFSGRKQAVFAVQQQLAEEDTALTARVRGIRYTSASLQKITTAELPYVEEQADVAITATYSTVDGGRLGTVFHVGGGGDNQEGFDELELYVYGGAFRVYAQGEASGERG